jgi:hypothetical protein
MTNIVVFKFLALSCAVFVVLQVYSANLAQQPKTTAPQDQDQPIIPSSAFVIPFVWCQFEHRIVPNIRAWHRAPPCDISDPKSIEAVQTLSLVFYFNRDLEAVHELGGVSGVPYLEKLWHSLGLLKSCFPRGVHYLSAKLTDEQNVYPTGTCVQFYASFAVLRGLEFGHWFQIEPDVLPMRTGWGSRVAEFAAQNEGCRNFWQAGSLPMYSNSFDFNSRIDGGMSLDLHLNGNSLYCLQDLQFDAYLSLVQQASPNGCGDRTESGWPMFGFDYAMYRFRVQSKNDTQLRRSFHKFTPVGFIVNIARQPFDESELLDAYPDMMLVHTQAFHDDKREMAECRKRERASNPHVTVENLLPITHMQHDSHDCSQRHFIEHFEATSEYKSFELTARAHLVDSAAHLTSIYPGDIGHVEFNAVYSKKDLCAGKKCSMSARLTMSVSAVSRLADGIAFSFVDAAKQTSGATEYTLISGVLVPKDALSVVFDEYDNGDGAGHILVASSDTRTFVIARKPGLDPAFMNGEKVVVQITVTEQNMLRLEVHGWVIFDNEYASVPERFYLVVSANSGDVASVHKLHEVELCTARVAAADARRAANGTAAS